jgi:hypothetical protein
MPFTTIISLLIALAVALPLAGQSAITSRQLKWGAPGEVQKLRLFAVGLAEMVQVQIGPGLRLEETADGIRLVAEPAPNQQISINYKVLVQDQNGNYPCGPCPAIYRNGVSQTEGLDFDRNAGGVLPRQPWAKDDIVKAEWIGPAPAPVAGIPCSEVWRAPGCCQSLADVKDCPAFDHLLPARFQAQMLHNSDQLRKSGLQFSDRAAAGGTVAKFGQVRNWTMLRNPNSKGTSIPLEQTPMPRDIADLWQSHAAKPQYDEYRVALVKTQSFPILITCTDGRCDDSWPLWFKSGAW